MGMISFILMLFAWINPLIGGLDVNVGPTPSDEYYYDDEGYYWYGPGYYNGIWFDDEDNWHRHHRHRGYRDDTRREHPRGKGHHHH